MRDYVAIEQARFGDKLEVVFEVDDVHIQVPSLLLQPLVENAISARHPAPQCARSGHHRGEAAGGRHPGRGARHRLRHQPGGDRRVAAGRVESRSIGLMNVHQRVKLLYGDGLHP